MKITDPIADMLTRLRNAGNAGHSDVEIPSSKLKTELARVLKEAGYIENFSVTSDGPKHTLQVVLKYYQKQPVIAGLKRVSKPSLRVYVGVKEIPRFMGGLGTVILSTPKGILTGKQAKAENVGGELLCYVW